MILQSKKRSSVLSKNEFVLFVLNHHDRISFPINFPNFFSVIIFCSSNVPLCLFHAPTLLSLMVLNLFFPGKDGHEQDLMKLCEAYFNVETSGNCDPRKDPHGELKNQNVLTVMGTDIDQLKEDFGLDAQGLQEKIGQIQGILYAERQLRPRPHLDDKILTSWNGLMISGYAVSGMALQNPDYVQRAVKAAEFLQKHMFDPENGTLLRSAYTEGSEVKQLENPIHGFVDDYAFLIRGLLDLYEATFEAKWVDWADQLQKKQNELFWDSTGDFILFMRRAK